MASHEEWVLRLADDLDAASRIALSRRFADRPCPSDDAFGEIAAHPNAPPDVLRALARRRTGEIDLSLGANPRTRSDVLAPLGRRRFDDVVEHVIRNRGRVLAPVRRPDGPARRHPE